MVIENVAEYLLFTLFNHFDHSHHVIKQYIQLAVDHPPDGIHPKVIERGIHILPYGIERQPQNFNQGD